MDGKKSDTIDSGKDVPSDEIAVSDRELLERIRQFEEEKRRFEDEKKSFEEERKSFEDEIERIKSRNDRLETENRIFRSILRSNGFDPDDFLTERKELLRRVNMNSSNSSKPPSSDGYRKPSPRSLRVKTGRKRGGQPGHPGHSLVVPHEPDAFVDHYPEGCQSCPDFGRCRSAGAFECNGRRSVIDLDIKVRVTEHRTFRADCPGSNGKDLRGAFPENVTAHVQYGDSFAIAAGVLDSFGYISDGRNAAILSALSGTTISPATVESLTGRCAEKVYPALARIRGELEKEHVTHHDETGTRIGGVLGWVHNTSTPRLTIQTIHGKRGREGIDAHGAVPRDDGISVHDCWAPYFGYGGKHAVCCAHLLRELTGIEENEPGHRWPTLFKEHLLSMKSAADAARGCGKASLDASELERFGERYDEILAMAEGECPAPPDPVPKRRGRKRKGKERALLERLAKLKKSVCMFVEDLEVPFDNNQAERDVRYVKVKSKVSGGFRTMDGAQSFLDVSSYLITARKNGFGAFEALRLAFEGKGETIVQARTMSPCESCN